VFVIQEELVLAMTNVNVMLGTLEMLVKLILVLESRIQKLFAPQEENVFQLTNVNAPQDHQEANVKS
jgi:hypothetical protein